MFWLQYNRNKFNGCDIMIKVSPSILGADFLDLAPQLETLETAGADMIHIDVMDGNFVPNISLGMPVINSIKKHTKLPLDVHLMIDQPHRYIKDFAKAADILGFHYEAGSPVRQTLTEIRHLGCKSCLTIKPKTDVREIFEFLELCDMVLVMSVEPGFGGQSFIINSLNKLSALKIECESRNLSVDFEVDGGINAETAKLAVDAGATVLVAGNYIFKSGDISKTVKYLKSL